MSAAILARRGLLLFAWGAVLGCESGGDPAPAVDMAPMPVVDAELPDPEDAEVPDPVDAAEGGGWIELGTGARSFEVLDPGQEVPIIRGIQGGYHVWGAFRGGGFDDSDVRTRFWLDLDGQTIARADYSDFGLPTDRRDPTVFEYAGVSVIYDSNDAVQPTSGNPMTLRVEVQSLGDGQVLRDSIQVVPVCCE